MCATRENRPDGHKFANAHKCHVTQLAVLALGIAKTSLRCSILPVKHAGGLNLTGSVPVVARLLRFAHNLAGNSFDSPRNLLLAGYSGCSNKKGTLACAFLYSCSQGESNSRPIVGNDTLYHLTMAAIGELLLLQLFCCKLNPTHKLLFQQSTADYSISDPKMQRPF